MKTKNFKVSVIVPALNEAGNIGILVQQVIEVLSQFTDYELIFVDDGSGDATLELLRKQHIENKRVKYISFSRNFGHQNALRAGFDYASGDCVISMDGDLQHPPKMIPQLIKKWKEGYDVVYTIRKEDPQLSPAKRITSRIFYWFMNKFTDLHIVNGAADFRLLDRCVIDILRSIKENDLFLRGVISWIGFKRYGIEYMPDKRFWGATKYTVAKMVKFAFTGITSFSVKPLQLSTFVGGLLAFFSFLYGIYAIVAKLTTESTISGWTSVLTVILFIGGIQLVMIGILGEYIGRLFIESKKRPNYIIKEKGL